MCADVTIVEAEQTLPDLSAGTKALDDGLNDPSKRRRLVVGSIVLLAFLALIAANTSYLMTHGHVKLVFACWALLAIVGFVAPGMTRNVIQASQGAPAIRFGDPGFWSRRWASLGWIDWRDVVAVEFVTTYRKKKEFHNCRLNVSEAIISRLPWSDWCFVMINRSYEASSWASQWDSKPGRRGGTLDIATSSLVIGWAAFVAALRPVLEHHGVQMIERSE